MLTYTVPNLSPLWNRYCDLGFSKSGHKGFCNFVKAMVPEGRVHGTVVTDIKIDFANEKDYTLFLLKWS